MVTEVSCDGLSPVEQSLVDHVIRGDRFDLIGDGVVNDKATMRSWGDFRNCHATVIRDILRGRLAPHPDPHGLRLRGVRIIGRLDLENLSTEVNFELEDCLLEEGLVARDAHLATVGLIGCQLEHPTEPPMSADRLTCSILDLSKATIIGHTKAGAVRLRDCHINGRLSCTGAELRNNSGLALAADNMQAGYDVFLNGGFTATGAGDAGAVRLRGCHIGGQLNCIGARLRNDCGPALAADNLQVDQGVFLRGGFTATGSGDLGAVRLVGAHIGGNLDCDGAKLRNNSGPALGADGLQVGHSVFLRGGFIATGVGQAGGVRLRGGHIGGLLDCAGAELRNDSGSALDADNLQVGQGVSLRGRFIVTGAGQAGAVRLRGSHIGGNLDCQGAELLDDSGPALLAGGLQVAQNVYLSDGFIAGGGADVAVNLTGARIGGALEFHPKKLTHTADSHSLAVNRLTDAGLPVPMSVRGWLDLLRKATPRHAAQPSQQLAAGYRALDLERPDPEQVAYAVGSHTLAVDGLTYAGVPKTEPPWDWRELLRDGTPDYAAQPYQQLAAGYRALGDDRQARHTLMAQRDDQLARTHPRWRERSWGEITKVTLGYGYQPWRALVFLAGVVAVSCVLAWLLGAHGALAQTSKTATPGRSCTVIQQVSVGLDLNLPVGTSLARAACDLTEDSASVTADWLAAVGWVLRLLTWVFAALFIAGFTSAVRKT